MYTVHCTAVLVRSIMKQSPIFQREFDIWPETVRTMQRKLGDFSDPWK
jgi:hypothetical protein